jgi:ATP-dependent Clp protease adapter protein ClpS
MNQPHSEPPPVPRPDLSRFQGQPQPRSRHLPPFKVILLSNPTLELMFIVRTVMELTRLCREEATHKMWEAYHNGRSVLLTTHRERAELFVEQFASKGLSVTLETA